MPNRRNRIVAVGDLNGAFRPFHDILVGVGLIDQRSQWIGGTSHLVQMGDIFNRGDSARGCVALLQRLSREATLAGGAVHVLLGNHEVLMADGLESYSTLGEYLSFATDREARTWVKRCEKARQEMIYCRDPDGFAGAFAPRFLAWQFDNVPGKAAMRRSIGPRGRIGRWLRKLPVAINLQSLLFVHGGLTPPWAAKGLEALNDQCRREWKQVDRGEALSKDCLLHGRDGPLWDRSLATGGDRAAESALDESLGLVGARRMIVGHTPTRRFLGGAPGRIATRFSSKLVGIDVGISENENSPRCALIVEGDRAFEWSSEGRRPLWVDDD